MINIHPSLLPNFKGSHTPERLADRVLQQEHRIYSQVIHWLAEERLKLQGQYVLLDGQPITFP